MKILVVDDEKLLVKGIKFNLEHEGYQVEGVYDGSAAVELARSGEYDLIILDVMMPQIDGLEACMRIREFSDVPIIMLTAKGEDTDKLMGFDCGADDYMTKPFNMLELKARIKNIFRRLDNAKGKANLTVAKVDDMTVDFISRSVTIAGREVNLTAKEFDLLQLFISNKGVVFEREKLLELIWKQKGDLRTVDVHIRRLREKIEEEPAHPQYILTKWGVGYYFSNK